MKKINSIWFGEKIIGTGLIFAAIIPLLLYHASFLFGSGRLFSFFIKGSVAIGTLILVFFIVLLTIELMQDRNINQRYNKTRNSKKELSDHNYECQNCGSRDLEKEDKFCKVCGIRFDK
jgi:membrane-bound acyltransferase YfiQ involved in biofilm formation